MPKSASAEFDAYHKWLGIPPAEQPPDHYRLLGIALFESDPEVIAAAADRQMAHVKSFAAGVYAAESQSLLNELARARIALLNTRQKAAYDRGLQLKLANDVDLRDFEDFVDAHNRGLQVMLADPNEGPLRSDQDGIVRSSADATAAAAHEFADVRELAQLARGSWKSTPHYRRRRAGNPALMIAIAAGLAGIAALLYYAAATRPTDAVRASKAPPQVVPSVNDRPRPASGLTSNNPRPRPVRAEAARDVPVEAAPLQPVIPDPPRNEPEQREQAQPRVTLPPAKRAVVLAIDLDLKKPRQRHIIKEATHTQFRVIALRKCTAPFSVKPKEGTLDAAHRVTLVVHGVRDAEIRLEANTTSQGATSIFCEYVIASDAGEEVAFTLPYLDRIRRQITNDGEQASSLLGAMEAEKSRLDAWIKSPVAKPLVERGQARARVRELALTIPEQTKFVQTLAANLQVADELFELATHLHDNCTVEVEVAE